MFRALLNPAIPMLLALDDEVVDQLCSLLRCVSPFASWETYCGVERSRWLTAYSGRQGVGKTSGTGRD
jgi:hypothetical protein